MHSYALSLIAKGLPIALIWIVAFQAIGEEVISPGLGNLLAQIPLVGVFIWFTLQLLKLQREERDQAVAKAREERMRRDEEWRSWLTAEQEKGSTALVGLVGETRKSAKTTQEVIEASTTQLDSMQKAVTKQTAVIMLQVAAQMKNGDAVGITEIVEMLQE